MPARQPRTPSYRLHKPTGQGVVTLDGKDHYLGPHDTATSRAAYDALVAEWLAHGRRLPTAPESSDITITELILGYLDHVDKYYVKDGEPTSEPTNIRLSLRPLRKLYGHSPAKDFGPKALKAVRQCMVDSGLCRNEVNRRARHVARLFKWAAAEELIQPSIYQALMAVPGLRKGRSDVRESEPVRPVPDGHVDAIKGFVPPQIWAAIELMRLSGARPGEVCQLRAADIDRSGKIWEYVPSSHKTQHHGRARKIFFGPVAQKVLEPWLDRDPEAFVFSPKEVVEHRRAEMRTARKTRVQPSQVDRRKAKPKRQPGDRYLTRALHHAVLYGIRRANRDRAARGEPEIPHWSPGQLRHNAATRLRREFGLDVARTVLGHSSPAVTLVYAEADYAKAADAMARLG